MPRPLIWGHRGTRRRAPENTLESFQLAEKEGVDGIELDVRMTLDKEPVIIHDPEFRTNGGVKHKVSCLTLKEALALGIPSLEAVLGAVSTRMAINIEIKADPDMTRSEIRKLVSAVARILERYPDRKIPVISSFHPRAIDRIKELIPHIPAGWLIKPLMLHKGSPRHFDYIHPHFILINPLFVLFHKIRGRKIFAWTVNNPLLALWFALLGVDGLITDCPGPLLKLFLP
jgi:glycerophosphoryl diester phosphodiesterase